MIFNEDFYAAQYIQVLKRNFVFWDTPNEWLKRNLPTLSSYIN